MLPLSFSAGLSSLEVTAPAEELDPQQFPLYARPRLRPPRLVPSRVVRVGTPAVDLDGHTVIVLRLSIDKNSAWWALVRDAQSEREFILPFTSLRRL